MEKQQALERSRPSGDAGMALKSATTWRRVNAEIGGNNQAAIDRCDAVFAVLDGTDVDS